MTLNLRDPREYSDVYPDANILINQATHDLAANDNNSLMCALIEDLLKQKQDQLLSVAYNLAPTQAIADYIWSSLQQVVNPSNQQGECCQLFVLPVVVIVGSSTQVTLDNKIDQIALENLFFDKKIFNSTETNKISANLVDLETIVKIKPSQLLEYTNEVGRFELSSLQHKPILNLGEGVHLRFLVGMAVHANNQESGYIAANFNQLGLELLQLLTTTLKHDTATVFPLPFPPCALSEAAVIGEHHRKEISIALGLSNQVKKMRLAGNEPHVKLSSQKNNIQIEVWGSKDSAQASEIMIWPLQRSDNFEQVCQILDDLFNDMQLMVSYYEEHHAH
jgi:hypothetical protein